MQASLCQRPLVWHRSFDHFRNHCCAIAIGVVLTIGGSASCSLVKSSQPCEVDAYALAHPHPLPDGVPNDWDKSIPIPAHASVADVSNLQGSRRRVDLLTRRETYAGLKSFYTTELGIAGYTVENPVEEPADKTFHVAFSACGRHGNVFIFPDQQKPKEFDVRVVYVVDTTATKTSTSSSVKKPYEACAFGDADACDQVNAQSGDPAVGAQHEAIIQEELKAREQREKDLGPCHGL